MELLEVEEKDKEEAKERRQCGWHLKRGHYLGEVSALCFLHHLHLPTTNTTPHLFSSSSRPPLPLLLAGTGSEILVYDLATADTVASFQVFEGTRVHGITLDPHFHHSDEAFVKLAVYGERRVKFYDLQTVNTDISPQQQHPQQAVAAAAAASSYQLELTLLYSLPKFTHWVLDVCFLKKNGATSSNQEGYWLAIGCTDNSVWFWDICTYTLVSQVRCPDRCLLYSMRMWGSDVESLRVASGTIYNEIIVWKLDFQNHSPILSNPAAEQTNSLMVEGVQLCGQKYQAVDMCRLTGHEGSIFRIAWLSDGSKLLSVSDDRSARVWVVNARGNGFHSSQEVANDFVGPVLFGHSARVWDCCIFDNLIITAGEDCTCRVWGPDGTQLKVIKEHIGRGVWRCLYDPISSLIITAGFDSALKVYQMHASSSKSPKGRTCCRKDLIDRKEVFSFLVPNTSGHIGLIDSKSEYVRCLQFSHEDSLYVATNNGYLHHLLFNTGEVKWTELVCGDGGAPMICMDLLSESSNLPGGVEDWLAIGNGKGRMMIVHVVGEIGSPKVEDTLIWSAEIERQLLGTYWCKSLGFRFVFTADPAGNLKLWRLCDTLAPISHSSERTRTACLIATYVSCFSLRIMCLDASSEDEVLVCGDIRGNTLLFPLSRSTLFGPSVSSEAKISPLSYFKGAHGISSVCSISISTSSTGQVDICTTGQDGCICYLENDKTFTGLEFIGMKSLKELSAVRSIFKSGDPSDLEGRDYAVGFASSDFIIWNLTTETKVVKVACGGWRRPHSYYIGNVPETNNCFAFIKNEMICIHRRWVPESESELYPQNLHLQFHGKEIHSVCFIAGESDYRSDKQNGMLSKTDWIATGCEDGTVRLTRYEPGFKNWSTSKLLGEHVGGSAVRSLCRVSKIYTILLDLTNMPSEDLTLNGAVEDPENPFLLISVGAKRVVTAWKQKSRKPNKREVLGGWPGIRDENGFHGASSSAISSTSFQWLSTDMPTQERNHARQNMENEIEATRNAYITSEIATSGALNFSNHGKRDLKACLADKCDDDWRYLAVTAFVVKIADSRISVCFVVVASSDATVTLRALLLPCRFWFDVVMLSPLLSPVLALQHVIVAKDLPLDVAKSFEVYFSLSSLLNTAHSYCIKELGEIIAALQASEIENIFLQQFDWKPIYGNKWFTDGSIAFWDLTKDVEDFMGQVSSLQMKDYIDYQRRPRTGRGSQGGRWWRDLGRHVSKKKLGDEHVVGSRILKGKNDNGSLSVKTTEKSDKNMQNDAVYGTSNMPYSEQQTHACSQVRNCAFVSEEKEDDSLIGIRKIAPLHVLHNVHQSGVNCLYVSDKKDMGFSGNRFTYYVLSGGDDQALNCVVFYLTLKAVSETCKNSDGIQSGTQTEIVENPFHSCQIHNYLMKFLSHEKIMSAHSSAVKGIWTDGNWVFSTGLDQRVRCWNLDQQGKLIERAHLVVSVPEPEAIDAQPCGRNYYRITVAGRGMQMVEFFASS